MEAHSRSQSPRPARGPSAHPGPSAARVTHALRKAEGVEPPPLSLGDTLDGDAIEALVREHQGPVRSFLRYLGCPKSTVDDLVQETFLTLLDSTFEVRDQRSTARYLRSIARFRYLKSLRRLDREPPALNLEAAENAWCDLREEDAGRPYMDALMKCLDGLRGRAREALDLRYGGGLGRTAIATRMALSESGVHSILVRARRRLRECVEGRLEG
ncbi:MAG: sigma-70 family RNA polymerase sigma factor [Planctomycetota bacterium]